MKMPKRLSAGIATFLVTAFMVGGISGAQASVPTQIQSRVSSGITLPKPTTPPCVLKVWYNPMSGYDCSAQLKFLAFKNMSLTNRSVALAYFVSYGPLLVPRPNSKDTKAAATQRALLKTYVRGVYPYVLRANPSQLACYKNQALLQLSNSARTDADLGALSSYLQLSTVVDFMSGNAIDRSIQVATNNMTIDWNSVTESAVAILAPNAAIPSTLLCM